MNIQCFTIEESSTYPGKCSIGINHDKFHLDRTEGSFNLICARLMNLSYAQWLRFCRDVCGATIVGKHNLYPVPYFPHGNRLSALVRLLNSRATLVLWEREHPDWEAHAQAVKNYKEAQNVSNLYN